MAGRYPEEWIEQLRQRADIVQTISAYVPLKKNGKDYWGLCPFHGEKTASFSVSPDKGFYYCFGCKASGTVINFVMEMERMTYSEAVVFLANRYNMPVPEMREDPNWQKRREQRERLLSANREAARYFHETLYSPAGEPMLAYLKKRGVDDATIRKFGLGAAPDRWDQLTQHLREMGYTEEELRLVDLTRVKEAEEEKPRRVFDTFRSRVMFPIINQHGEVIAFGGRALGDEKPKYLNSSDTPVFNKRQGVYAANLLYKERSLRRVILVEGYMDVVALTQFGIKGVCATLGTALTEEQARLLKRYAPTVYLAYDGDAAGQKAILRGLDIFEREQFPARVLDFPDGLDPDEFIRRDGLEGFENLPALSPAAYRVRRMADDYPLDRAEGRADYARAAASLMAKVDPVEREGLLKQLSLQTGLSREVLLEQIALSAPAQSPARARLPKRAARQIRESVPEGEPMDRTRAQETMISLLATGQLPKDVASEADFEDSQLREFYTALRDGKSPAALIEEQGSEADRARCARLMQPPPGGETDELIRMVEECVRTMRRSRAEEQLNQLKERLAQAQGAEKAEIMGRIVELTKTLKDMKNRT